MGLLQNEIDGEGEFGPVGAFFGECGAAFFGDVVVASFAAGFAFFPIAGHDSVGLEFVEVGVEGAFAPREGAVGVAVDGGGEFVAVLGFTGEE